MDHDLTTINLAMSKARTGELIASFGVVVATAIFMLATERHLAIVWDEGFTLGREVRDSVRCSALRDPGRFAVEWRPSDAGEELVIEYGTMLSPPQQLDTRSKLIFERRVVEWFWPFAREEPHGHPPFYALVGLTGDLLTPSWQQLPRARLGPILVFSFTAGAIFQFLARRWGVWPAALAASAWVLQPNLFAHGHYASYDGLLTSLWVLAIFAFVCASEATGFPDDGAIRWSSVFCFGLILGCALATKLTGWFLPLPFLIWAGWYRDGACA